MNTDESRTVRYEMADDAQARSGWYLEPRDNFVARLVSRACPSGGSVLDVGCSAGYLCPRLRDAGFTYTGVDADAQSVEYGRSLGHGTLEVMEANSLRFDDNSFDVCVASEVLEHLDDDVGGLKELLRVSRGPVVITVPAYKALWTDSDDKLLHRRRYSRQEVRSLAEAGGADIVKLSAYGVMPALGVLAYKVFSGGEKRADDGLPLGARYKLPAFVDKTARVLFEVDLWMSEHGLVPCGHGWWAILKKMVNG